MKTTRDYFNDWFKKTLSDLYVKEEAGFIVFMMSLTLLERYLRQKTGLNTRGNARKVFSSDLSRLFPKIGGIGPAEIFWEVCRHGLMHQATFRIVTESGETISEIGLHNDADVVEYKSDGSRHCFVISPVKFSKAVIREIENDFSTFEGHGSPDHPLPEQARGVRTGYSGISGYESPKP
jgi:hypothetical protein